MLPRKTLLLLSKFVSRLMDVFRILPKNQALFKCFPDFEDQSFSMILELTKQSIPIFLISDSNQMPNHWREETLGVKLIKSQSLLSFFYAKTSKYIFHTHGFIFSESISREQVVVNLWHGIPLKKIGIEVGHEMPNSTFSLITSTSKSFLMERTYSNLKKKPVFINFGLPRLDLLKPISQSSKVHPKKIIWAPTHRDESISEILTNRFVNNIWLGMTMSQLIQLDKFFLDRGISVELLLHPMFRGTVPVDLSAIYPSPFDRNSQSLYRYINNFDALMTDFSSISIDYLVTRKPLYIFAPGLESYEKSRGLFGDLETLLGIQVLKDVDSLMKEMDTDNYDFLRLEKALNDWHDYRQNDRASKIWQRISEVSIN